jgi:hypothetical protein
VSAASYYCQRQAEAQPLASGGAEADDVLLTVTLIMPGAAAVASSDWLGNHRSPRLPTTRDPKVAGNALARRPKSAVIQSLICNDSLPHVLSPIIPTCQQKRITHRPAAVAPNAKLRHSRWGAAGPKPILLCCQ